MRNYLLIDYGISSILNMKLLLNDYGISSKLNMK